MFGVYFILFNKMKEKNILYVSDDINFYFLICIL